MDDPQEIINLLSALQKRDYFHSGCIFLRGYILSCSCDAVSALTALFYDIILTFPQEASLSPTSQLSLMCCAYVLYSGSTSGGTSNDMRKMLSLTRADSADWSIGKWLYLSVRYYGMWTVM